MKKSLEPHGTKAGYMRHWRAGEEACGPCLEANAKNPKKAREINPQNAEVRAMDLALIENPPVIHWRKNNRGVFVADMIDDPHADMGHNGTKTACKRNHPFTEDNTIVTPTGRQCRTCTNKRKSEHEKQHRRENALLAAARTEI